jgi:hypothetical protein
MIKDIWEVCLEKVFNDPTVGKKSSVLLGDICNYFKIPHPRYIDHEDDRRMRNCEGIVEIRVNKMYKDYFVGKTRNEAKGKPFKLTLAGCAKKLILKFIYDAEYAFMTRKFLLGFFKKIDNRELQNLIPKEEDVLNNSSIMDCSERTLIEIEPLKSKPDDEELLRLNFNIFCAQYERAHVPVDEFCVKLFRFAEETFDGLKVSSRHFKIRN